MSARLQDWTDDEPTEDGVYLSKFDIDDGDEDTETFHLKGGKFYKNGEPWIVHGGIWKRIGDLPSRP